MDGHSHHNHQNRDLQVSKNGVVDLCKGNKANQNGSKGELTREIASKMFSYVHMFISCMLSATDAECV